MNLVTGEAASFVSNWYVFAELEKNRKKIKKTTFLKKVVIFTDVQTHT